VLDDERRKRPAVNLRRLFPAILPVPSAMRRAILAASSLVELRHCGGALVAGLGFEQRGRAPRPEGEDERRRRLGERKAGLEVHAASSRATRSCGTGRYQSPVA
jgi:hypothetical protein